MDSEVVLQSTFCSVAEFPFLSVPGLCLNALAVLRLWVALFEGSTSLVNLKLSCP